MLHVTVTDGDELLDSAIGDALNAQLPERVNVFVSPLDTEPVEVRVNATGWARVF